MSLFESVFVKLICQRCGKVHDNVVRFRSYVGREDGEYELMEVASSRDGLVTGEVWEGNADRYCSTCYQKWAAAQAYAGYDALAELIEKGLVTAKAQGSQTPLEPSAMSEYAEEYADECREDGCFPVTMPYFEELDLSIRDKPCHPVDLLDLEDEAKAMEIDEIWSELLGLIDPLISARLRKDGWVEENIWEDFRVSLDDERRVVVEDMDGRRLTRDGGRVSR